uniref:Egrl-1 n=1 Tax=Dendrocoelum lacteum TaxID=27895 RepID=T1E116_9PLAT
MVRNVIQLSVKIDLSEFDNFHTGYTPFPGVHQSFYGNDTTQIDNIKTPSPIDCKDIEFILVYSSTEEKSKMSSEEHFTFSMIPKPKTDSQTMKKKFICSTCMKPFFRRDELRRHGRIHSGERPLACDFCDKRFMRSDHRTTHRRIHTGEKPYKCHFCASSFGRSDERLRHMRVNHAFKRLSF